MGERRADVGAEDAGPKYEVQIEDDRVISLFRDLVRTKKGMSVTVRDEVRAAMEEALSILLQRIESGTVDPRVDGDGNGEFVKAYGRSALEQCALRHVLDLEIKAVEEELSAYVQTLLGRYSGDDPVIHFNMYDFPERPKPCRITYFFLVRADESGVKHEFRLLLAYARSL